MSERETPGTILLTGATGFVGGQVLRVSGPHRACPFRHLALREPRSYNNSVVFLRILKGDVFLVIVL